MKIQPLDDRVLIKPLETEEKTAGGIVIPDTAKEKPIRGLVEAVGNGRVLDNGERFDLSLKKGDKVLFGKYSGTEIKIEGVEYKIMKESEVLAKID
ncbi:MAG: co-chaperone GroES [Planctomycetes bacterium]|nr:co-chaperone GroES [Planctomycetota bacterium]MBI3846765.1 co-chaperone GroES [Planctomycetota bacterium]